jgi:hypothetical protein
MSILSNHHVEALDELNGHGPEDDMGHGACGQASPDGPTASDWEEYGRWSESLDQQPAPAAAAEPAKPARARKPRAKRPRVFNITFTIGGTHYKVYPLAIDPSIGRKAFRFAKQGGDGAVYDLLANEYGLQCQCRGFEAHGHCKHVETTQVAGRLFNLL